MKDSIKEYGEFFQRMNLSELSIEDGDFKIFMKKESAPVIMTAPAVPVNPAEGASNAAVSAASLSAAAIVNAGNASEAVAGKVLSPDMEEIKAPLLGTFYANKDALLVKVGDTVRKGDVLCNIEAMKMFNEVLSNVDGVVSDILVRDGELVEYNQTLFIIKKA
ncbi:MAG: acetyl-CoA carboxylase, biotin carboxyl carrier protein [Lachnospiraceae bacterium]|nr:acetyl-CoA carboxylase, biotin carboxyl carrier protein [Lachnospiraceae bacterium]